MVTRTTGAWEDLAASIGRPRPRREEARWRGRSAIATVVLGLVVSQAIGVAIAVAAGRGAMVALGLVVADLILLAIVVAVAARGAERLGPATFGIRRTAFGPALGWGLALLMLNFALSGVLALLFGSSGTGSGRAHHAHHLATGTAVPSRWRSPSRRPSPRRCRSVATCSRRWRAGAGHGSAP